MDEIILLRNKGVDINNDNELLKYANNQDLYIYYRNKLRYYEKIGVSYPGIREEQGVSTLEASLVDYLFYHSPNIVFEVTESCNMSCKYCVYGDLYKKEDRTNRQLRSSQMIAAIKQFIRGRSGQLSVGFYGGEPLLSFNAIKEVVNQFQREESSGLIKWRITTNATLLNEEVARFFIRHNFSVLISLDGDAECNAYRVYKDGRQTFNDVIYNIGRMRTLDPAFFQNNVRFNSVLHNKNSVKKIYDFFSKEFEVIPSISELTNINREASNNEFAEIAISSASSHSTAGEITFDTSPQKRMLYSLLRFSTPNYFRSLSYLFKNNPVFRMNSGDIIPSGTCLPFQKKIFISSQGDIKPCEKIPIRFSLGFADDNGMHIDSNHIAAFYNSIYKRIWNNCQDCKIRSNCNVCTFYLDGVLDANKQLNCQYYKDESDYSKITSQLIEMIETNYSLYLNCINTIIE